MIKISGKTLSLVVLFTTIAICFGIGVAVGMDNFNLKDSLAHCLDQLSKQELKK